MDIKYLPIVVGLLLGSFNFLEKMAISKYGISYQGSAITKFSAACLAIWIMGFCSQETRLFSGDKIGYLFLIASGILNALAILVLYYSFRFLDVSYVTPVYSTIAIIFISILGAVILKEPLDLYRVIGILCCLVGIFLMFHQEN